MYSPKYLKGGTENINNFIIKYNHGPNFYIQFKDDFIREIYKFNSLRTSPIIIDGGSNIGLSILYFKSIYPESKIIGFEPDPEIFTILKENIIVNGIDNIQLHESGLGAKDCNTLFNQDGMAGGHIEEGSNTINIKMERLSNYLNNPIDFLKLNIEGKEIDVLKEIDESNKIKEISEMVIEYHGFPNLKQTLGDILSILNRNNFRYLIHDFDSETCSITKPPFNYNNNDKWYCLIYAKNNDNLFNENDEN